jgi:hypothetical protein
MPERVSAGAEAALRIHAPGLTAPINGTLRIPGIADMEAIRVRVPGELRLRIPAGTRPAWYRVELSGRGICPAVSLFKVVP